jgi:hypothetical protein
MTTARFPAKAGTHFSASSVWMISHQRIYFFDALCFALPWTPACAGERALFA